MPIRLCFASDWVFDWRITRMIFVDVRQGQEQAFDRVFLLSSPRQQKLGSSANDLHTMSQKLPQEIFDGQLSRFPVDQRHKVHRERRLQR